MSRIALREQRHALVDALSAKTTERGASVAEAQTPAERAHELIGRETAAPVPNKRKLTELFVKKVKPHERVFLVWDTHQRGLALQVQPTGHRA